MDEMGGLREEVNWVRLGVFCILASWIWIYIWIVECLEA